MTHVAYDGRLLVAMPMLEDPNFDRTIVLLLGHDEDGALGVILNRPTRTAVDDVLDGWGQLAAAPANVFDGGPVQPRAVVGLAVARLARLGSAGPEGTIVDRICTIDPSEDPSVLRDEIEQARIFAGYAGWAPGQLEDEIEEGAWIVVDAEPGDVVAGDPTTLWADVLRRQGGSVGLLAGFPDDPRLN